MCVVTGFYSHFRVLIIVTTERLKGYSFFSATKGTFHVVASQTEAGWNSKKQDNRSVYVVCL